MKPPSSHRPWAIVALQGSLVVGAVWFIFAPVMHAGWNWDDNVDLLQNRLVHDPAGWWKIWLTASNVDYFPLKATVNWVQWRLWGADPLGYHLTNIVLHTVSAGLFWRLLRRLGLAAAWWGGLLLAIHPLAVESVAWIAELKNTLSLPCLLLAMTAYVDFDSAATAKRRQAPYGASLAWFGAAMLAKTSVAMFPVTLLLYAWWRRGRISRRDVLASLPFFAISLALGSVTIWFQSHDTDVGLGAASLGHRLLVAGQILGFYALKCVWPSVLMPIYPRWSMGPAELWPLLIWGLIAAAFALLWTRRTPWSRATLFGLGCFAFNLAPVLGIVSMSFLRYSAVSDHLAYVALLGMIGLAVATGQAASDRIRSGARPVLLAAAAAVCGLLAIRSRLYAQNFRDGESLWSYAVRQNPASAVAQTNLGVALAASGRQADAIARFERALQLDPDQPNAHFCLGNSLREMGRLPEAVTQFEAARKLDPNNFEIRHNLANALFRLAIARSEAGHWADAITPLEQTIELQSDFPDAEADLGMALANNGRVAESIPHFQRAATLNPQSPEARRDLATAQAALARQSAR